LWRDGPGLLFNMTKGHHEPGVDWHFVDKNGSDIEFADGPTSIVAHRELDLKEGWINRGKQKKHSKGEKKNRSKQYIDYSKADPEFQRQFDRAIDIEIRLREGGDDVTADERDFLSRNLAGLSARELDRVVGRTIARSMRPAPEDARWAQFYDRLRQQDSVTRPHWQDQYHGRGYEFNAFSADVRVDQEGLLPQASFSLGQSEVPTVVPKSQPLPPLPVVKQEPTVLFKAPIHVKAEKPSEKSELKEKVVPATRKKRKNRRRSRSLSPKPAVKTNPDSHSSSESPVQKVNKPKLLSEALLKESPMPSSPFIPMAQARVRVFPLFMGDHFIGNCSPMGNYFKTCAHVVENALKQHEKCPLQIRYDGKYYATKSLGREEGLDYIWLTKPAIPGLKKQAVTADPQDQQAAQCTLLAWMPDDKNEIQLFMSQGEKFPADAGKQVEHWMGSDHGMSGGVILNRKWQDVCQHEGGSTVGKCNVAHHYTPQMLRRSFLGPEGLFVARAGLPPSADVGKS